MSGSIDITGIGTFLPETVKRNEDYDLAAGGVDDAWLAEAGLVERRCVAAHETILDLALMACRRALDHARLAPADVDLLILCSSTFRQNPVIPTGVAQLKDRLGIGPCISLTLAETCCGALLAMDLAAGYLQSGRAHHALVVAAECFSRAFDPTPGVTFRLGMAMGDGAGAVVLSRREDDAGGLLATYLDSGARFQSGLGIKPDRGATPGREGAALRFGLGGQPPSEDGRVLGPDDIVDAIRRFTTGTVPTAVRGVLARAGRTRDEVDLFVLHQPSRRFLREWRDELGIPAERTLDTLERFGNLSSVSVLVNLDAAVQQGRLRPGQTVVLAAAGEGASWGAMLWRWTAREDPDRDDLVRDRPRPVQARLVTIENQPLTEILANMVVPNTRDAYPHDELFRDFVPAWAVFEGVPLERAFEFLADTTNMALWTISMRRLRRVQGDVFRGDEEATPTGRVFIRTLSDAHAHTIEWRCSHTDPDDLWIVYKGQLVDAQLALGRPGCAFFWMNFVHARVRADPALAMGFRLMFAAHMVEIGNLKRVLEDRFAGAGALAATPPGPM